MGSERRTNPHRLYRERDEALLAGVCAGLARYFGFNRRGVRLVVAVSALFFLPFVAVSYLVLAIVLPTRPRDARGSGESRFLARCERRAVRRVQQRAPPVS